MGLATILTIGSGTLLTIGLAYRKYMSIIWGWHDTSDEQDVEGKIIVITGANDGLGKETAYELYKRGATIIMACRNMESAILAANEIKTRALNETLKGELIPMQLDLQSFDSVRNFAKSFQESFDHLNILINNAGVYIPHSRCEYNTTVDGYEINLQINHLSHFLLTLLLTEQLKKGSPSRIINVSSQLYEKARLNISDINLKNLEPSALNSSIPYANSKLANILFSRELANRLQGNGIHTYALSPGWVKTSIGRNMNMTWLKLIFISPMIFLFMRSVHQGCQTILQCVLSNECGKETGKLYRNCNHWIPSAKVTDNLAKQLWEFSENAVGEKLNL